MNVVDVPARRPQMFESAIGSRRTQQFLERLERARAAQGQHTLWHVNSTARGGGVAEMLQSILSYLVGAGIACRWIVVEGNERFFEVTKGLHHHLHASPGGGDLDGDARAVYEETLAGEAEAIVEVVRPGDVVILNDPQTLGLAPSLEKSGARTIFTSHVGADAADERTRAAWSFLEPYVTATQRQVFTRQQYVWAGLDPHRVAVIPPCLDAFSAKNQDLDDATVDAILASAGIVAGGSGSARFSRQDGSVGTVTTRAEMVETAPIEADRRIATQVSRWDPLKDPAGVMAGFVRQVPAESDVHLVLAGPAPQAVADDPESQRVLDELRTAWERLPAADRARVHIACLPMDDVEQNAATVNALQRRSDVVVQKSLAEGFGLTVAEAMWKGRATIGSRVGGIQDQIEHGRSGLLLDDPRAVDDFGQTLAALLHDAPRRAALGAAACERVADRYLAPDHLTSYLDLVDSL